MTSEKEELEQGLSLPRPSDPARAARITLWAVCLTSAVVLVGAFHLWGLGRSPPGLWQDEAQIGYNSWTIAHYGLDEHGVAWPVFFEGYGDYNSPIYWHLLAPLTRPFALTPTLVRFPATVIGLAICMILGVTAGRLTRSRWIGLLTFVVAGFTPWVVMQGRVGFECIALLLLTAVALHAAVQLAADPSRRWAIVLGVALAAMPYAYATGRVAAVLFGVAFCTVLWLQRRLRSSIVWVLAPVTISFAFLALWAHANPGALTARFSKISVFVGSPSLVTAAGRAAGNYVSYFGLPYLFVHGDSNLRHNTGAGGMLLWGMVPVLLAGMLWCLRRWREPLPQLLLLGLLAAPVPAALTQDGTPHGLRSAIMLPFLFAVGAVGWHQLLRWRGSAKLVTAVIALLLVGQAAQWTVDFFVSYPLRAQTWFQEGELDAITLAADVRGGGRLYLSRDLGEPYIIALFALRPDPRVGLEGLHIEQVIPEEIATRAVPGDVVVLAPWDTPPQGATLLATEPAASVWEIR